MPDWDKEIIIDSREPWEGVFNHMAELDAPEYRLEALDHKADYIIRNEAELAIQRKTISDFASSLDTLKEDLFKLRTHYEYSALLLEGDWKVVNGAVALRRGSNYHQTIPVTTLHNFVLSQQIRGTMLLQTMNLEETCRLMVDYYDYLDGDIPTGPSGRNPSTILTLFPGIGPTTAGRLMEKYGNVGDALDDIENWDDIKGIGDKKIEGVLSWLYDN